jgi:hypothetical protein
MLLGALMAWQDFRASLLVCDDTWSVFGTGGVMVPSRCRG